MISEIVLFGKVIPLYGICFYAGIAIAAAFAMLVCRKNKFPKWEILYSSVYIMIGAVLGAKLLFIAVSWKDIIKYDLSLIAVIKGGFVFYGGLIGGFVGLWLYTKIYRMHLMEYIDIYAVVLPIGHAIGRVGCFFAGCCYGIPCSFGVVYTQTVGQTPLGIRLFPIQLAEAVFLVILFVVQYFVYSKTRKGTATFTYCLSYSAIRFVLEFLRGDAERGKLGLLSTSQWICVGIACITIAVYIILYRKNRKVKSEL